MEVKVEQSKDVCMNCRSEHSEKIVLRLNKELVELNLCKDCQKDLIIELLLNQNFN